MHSDKNFLEILKVLENSSSIENKINFIFRNLSQYFEKMKFDLSQKYLTHIYQYIYQPITPEFPHKNFR